MGHNPSEESWKKRIPYAHRTNRFWKLLESSELISPSSNSDERGQNHTEMPWTHGIGFIDLFVTCGSDAAQINMAFDHREFVNRLGPRKPHILAFVSKMVAEKFLGAKQYKSFCRKAGSSNKGYGYVGTGRQWGLGVDDLNECRLWVLPSTSGRASLSWEVRLQPFVLLRQHLEQSMPEWSPISTLIPNPVNKIDADRVGEEFNK